MYLEAKPPKLFGKTSWVSGKVHIADRVGKGDAHGGIVTYWTSSKTTLVGWKILKTRTIVARMVTERTIQ